MEVQLEAEQGEVPQEAMVEVIAAVLQGVAQEVVLLGALVEARGEDPLEEVLVEVRLVVLGAPMAEALQEVAQEVVLLAEMLPAVEEVLLGAALEKKAFLTTSTSIFSTISFR